MRVAHHHDVLLDFRLYSGAGGGVKALQGSQGQRPVPGLGHDGLAQGVLAARFNAGRQA